MAEEISKQFSDTNLPIGNADFESIKQDLINFYKNTDEFRDYNFEGSRMSQQMNLLAYVTLYNQQYANTALFESFLRTAKDRRSVVQAAQDKGYIPASVTASKDIVTIYGTVSGDTSTSVLIPRGSSFSGTTEGRYNYNFITWEDISVSYNETEEAYVTDVPIVQGYKGIQYIRFDDKADIILYDKDIDRNYIKVAVSDDNGNYTYWDNWTRKSLVNLSSQATVFYINETVDGFTRIYFGRGVKDETDPTKYNYVGGLKPAIASNVRIEYLKTDGEDANGAKDFVFTGSIPDFTILPEDVISNPKEDPLWNGSYGAGDEETTENIRQAAEIFNESQNRCVTAYDYEAFVRKQFSSIVQAVKVYGEQGKPGYAFIAIKPIDALSLTELQKNEIISYLEQYNVLTITPVIIQPNYVYLHHNININYRPNSVPEGAQFLKDTIVNAVDQYYTDHVEKFGGSFHSSKMLKYVDASNIGILGSSVNINLIIEVGSSYVTKTPEAGLSFMNPVNNIISSAIVYTHDTTTEPYEIEMRSVDNKIIVGPFAAGHINEDIYEPIEIFSDNVADTVSDDKFFVIGTFDEYSGTVTYDFNVIGIQDKVYSSNLTLTCNPERSDIYSSNGGLIVFEPTVRPQYIDIELEQIINE